MKDLAARNRRTFFITLGIVAGMAGMAYASVPLYRMICQVTGWGGMTRMVAKNESQVVDRNITVRFNADVARGMPWTFNPEIKQLDLKVGQDGFVSFLARNDAEDAVKGTAVYNVTPLKAGKYFYKTQCFCFGEQTLPAGESVHMPVAFFIDPAIMEDAELKDLNTITLSYTFFRHGSAELEKAVDKYLEDASAPAGGNI